MARKKYSFYIDESQADALKAVKVRDGVLESEQIRRALNNWFKRIGISVSVRRRSTRARA
jgi:hypothetical protein